MPLSDREQQILSEIESQLESDIKLRKTLRDGALNPARFTLRTGIAGMVIGLIMMLMIAINPWGLVVALIGFVLTLISAVTVGNHLKSGTGDNGLGGQIKGGFSQFLEGRRKDLDDQ